MKPCIACQQTKPIEAYYPHAQMADGHLNKCKECVRAYTNARRRTHTDHVRTIDRQRSATPERRAKAAEYARARRLRQPEKYRARMALNNAVRDGRLQRLPCHVCGAAKSQAHHHDYSQPLDVEWLCFTCHRRAHGALVA